MVEEGLCEVQSAEICQNCGRLPNPSAASGYSVFALIGLFWFLVSAFRENIYAGMSASFQIEIEFQKSRLSFLTGAAHDDILMTKWIYETLFQFQNIRLFERMIG